VIHMPTTKPGQFQAQGNVPIIGPVRPVSRLTLGLFAGVAGSLTLMWVSFLGWLAFGAVRLALGLVNFIAGAKSDLYSDELGRASSLKQRCARGHMPLR
jgi:hypothetical protein